jgi:arginase family enzyme
LPAIRGTCERIAGLVGAALGDGRIPIVLGGDHSIAHGTVGGLASRAFGRAPRRSPPRARAALTGS